MPHDREKGTLFPLRPGLIGHGLVTGLVTDGSLPQSQSITKPTVDSDRFYE